MYLNRLGYAEAQPVPIAQCLKTTKVYFMAHTTRAIEWADREGGAGVLHEAGTEDPGVMDTLPSDETPT